MSEKKMTGAEFLEAMKDMPKSTEAELREQLDETEEEYVLRPDEYMDAHGLIIGGRSHIDSGKSRAVKAARVHRRRP